MPIFSLKKICRNNFLFICKRRESQLQSDFFPCNDPLYRKTGFREYETNLPARRRQRILPEKPHKKTAFPIFEAGQFLQIKARRESPCPRKQERLSPYIVREQMCRRQEVCRPEETAACRKERGIKFILTNVVSGKA